MKDGIKAKVTGSQMSNEGLKKKFRHAGEDPKQKGKATVTKK